MIRLKKFLMTLVSVLIVLSSSAQAEQWDFLIDMPPNYTYYIETSSVFCDELREDEIIFHSFMKSVYTAEGRKKRLKRFMDTYGYLPEGAANIAYSIFLEHFKWSKGVKYYTVDWETVCTADGSVVREMGFRRSYHDWKVIAPGAISDALFDSVFGILAARLNQ